MKNIMGFFTNHILVTVMMATVTGITLLTSLAGVVKVAGSMDSFKPSVPEVKTVQAAIQEESNLANTEAKPTAETAKFAVNMSAGSKTTDATPTPVPTTTVSSSGSQTTTGGCIITLFGKQYDVTSLRSTHSGGDVFKCGTDQTSLYESVHGTDVSRMQQYLVSTSSGSSASAGTTVNTASSSNQQTGTGSSVSVGEKIQLDNEIETEGDHETGNDSKHQSNDTSVQQQVHVDN